MPQEILERGGNNIDRREIRVGIYKHMNQINLYAATNNI
jgi:hypothetical protein